MWTAVNIHLTGNIFTTMEITQELLQIWRMKPDGSGREQLTSDNYNNWFPHISPDGKWIVIISFPLGIDPKKPSFL